MIKVRLKPEQGIKVRLSPNQSSDVDLKTVYLYDPDWIPAINEAVLNANKSEQNAKESELKAKSSETLSKSYEESAKESKDIAVDAKNTAVESSELSVESARKAKESEDVAKDSAGVASESMEKAIESEQKARIWADGNDSEVQPLGGTHSSMVSSGLAYAYAVAPEDVPVEEWATTHDLIVQGEKGDKGEQGIQGEKGDKGDTPDISGKQDKIEDLEEIRQGASKGETAVQPDTLNDYATTQALTDGLNTKQDTLKPGENITIEGNVISATGGGGDVDVLEAIKGQMISPSIVNVSEGQIQIGYGQVQTTVNEDNKNTTSTTNMIFGGNMGIWSDYQFYNKKTDETAYQSIGLNFTGSSDVELSAMTMDNYGYSTVFIRSSELYLDYSGYDGSARALVASVKTGKITYSDAEKGEIELDIYDLLSAVKNIIDNGEV